MSCQSILPLILCGGGGIRLWPLSRESYPKQYLEINRKESTTFLQKTLNRLYKKTSFQNPILICNEADRFIVAEQIRQIDIIARSILLEPVRRNTAPAITSAIISAMKNGEDPTILVLPSDHFIQDEDQFIKVIENAKFYSDKGKIVLFGIKPSNAETGYGYIESKSDIDFSSITGQEINRFIEKPDKFSAEAFIKQEKFLWNSGMFLFKASKMINEIKKREPNLYELCVKSLSKNLIDLSFQRLDKEFFEKCENISIDKAIMEKTDLGIVVPLAAGWKDIGSWRSMWEVGDKDNNDNVILGEVFTENISNCYLRSDSRLIVGIGLENLIVVETDDAILVANKNQTQRVKHLVEHLNSIGKEEANTHKRIYRPWGCYISISDGDNWQIKKIIVKPKESLSLQLHQYRTEHWIVVSGKAFVEIEDRKIILEVNQSTYIPRNTKHRLSNPGEEELILIEVQSGSYLGEDDIKRFDDKYGRI